MPVGLHVLQSVMVRMENLPVTFQPFGDVLFTDDIKIFRHLFDCHYLLKNFQNNCICDSKPYFFKNLCFVFVQRSIRLKGVFWVPLHLAEGTSRREACSGPSLYCRGPWTAVTPIRQIFLKIKQETPNIFLLQIKCQVLFFRLFVCFAFLRQIHYAVQAWPWTHFVA